MHGLALSVGGIVGALHTVAQRAAPLVAGIREQIRASPVLHVDETGWRQDGHNGYVWTFSTTSERAFVRGSRERAVLEGEIGPDYAGVLVSDFYAAYDQLDGRHQRCWAHLLRDIHELQVQHPTAARLHAWAEGMHALFTGAVAWTAAAGACPPAEREHARRQFEATVLALCRAEPAGEPHAALCQRVERYHPELFTFVADSLVPPTNNAAERSLRPLVVSRKISGGTRSPQGSRTRMILQSVVATWELRGLDPLAELLTLLRAPRTPLLELPPV